MEYKILINKEAVPGLIEVPEKPSLHLSSWIKGASSLAEASRLYEQALTAAIADEKTHISFKDIEQVFDLLNDAGQLPLVRSEMAKQLRVSEGFVASYGLDIKSLVGQTFPLPDNVRVSFEEKEIPIRRIVYAYLQLPYHEKVNIQKEFDEYRPTLVEQDKDRKLFEAIKKSNKLGELADRLAIKSEKLAILTPLGAKEYQPLNVSSEALFCKIYSAEYGEPVDSIYQIKIDTFDGLELLTLCQKFADTQRNEVIQECIEVIEARLLKQTDNNEFKRGFNFARGASIKELEKLKKP